MCVSIDSHLPHLVYLTIVLNVSLVLSICVSVLACLIAMAHLVCFSTVLNGVMWSVSWIVCVCFIFHVVPLWLCDVIINL